MNAPSLPGRWAVEFAVLMIVGLTPSVSTSAEPDSAARSPFDLSRVPEIPPISAPSVSEIESSIGRGVAFLVGIQNENGSWGSATRTKQLNIYAPVPGAHDAFRTATTALCLSALIELQSAPGKLPDGEEISVSQSIDRGEKWFLKHLPELRRANGQAIYNVWGHLYSISALVRMRERHQSDAAMVSQIDQLVNQQFDMLRRYESVDGGWGYYDFRYQAQRPTSSSISFVAGAALVAMAEARDVGLEPPERIVKRAIAAMNRQRKPDFSYLYGEYLKDRPMREINRPGGSLGRSQCCNYALRIWGDESISNKVIQNWLYRLYARNGWLDIGRKRPVPHESWMQVAGYFYYFGHFYAALSIDLLPEDERGPYQAMLARLMVERQEKNGSWWDYPLYNYHYQYGTAMALMTLHRCRTQQ